MNTIKTAALRVVPSARAVACSFTRRPSVWTLQSFNAGLLALAAGCAFMGVTVKAATDPAPLPVDLTPVQLSEVPRTVPNLFSISHFPAWPPLPAGCASSYTNSDFYLSPSLNALFVDDRQSVAMAMVAAAASPPSPPGVTDGSGNPDDPGPSYGPTRDYSTNFTDLYLSISSATGGVAAVVMHNTVSNTVYEVLSSEPPTNALSVWASEGLWLAVSTNTPANIAIGSRTRQLCFDARVWSGAFDHGVPTNGQLFLLVNTNSIYPVINGVTTNLAPFYGNWVMLNPPLYQVNLGYDASDNGFTNDWIQPRPPQGVKQVLGFSSTLSNLCLSYNPLTNINVAGWPALQDLECWHCTNLVYESVVGCPKLARVCFEAADNLAFGIQGVLDFTGCPEIADIRSANTRITNVVFAGGAGSNVWHFCVHDNSGLNNKYYNLSQFPSMKQLWAWRDYIWSDLNYSTSTSHNTIEWVDCFGNYIRSADFRGQTHLTRVVLYSNGNFTNLNIAGCSNLSYVDVSSCAMAGGAVDDVFTNLDQMGLHSGYVDVTGDALPSEAGMLAVSNLIQKDWAVWPSGLAPAPCANGTSPIWFSNTSTTVYMQVHVNPATVTAITWYWGDCSHTCGLTEVSHSLAAGCSNAVVVDPPEALLAFGAGSSAGNEQCNHNGGTQLSAVGGLTNYPNLQELHLYQSGVSNLSLAGCSQLVSVALVGTSPVDAAAESQWFVDLSAAQSKAPTGNPSLNCSNGRLMFYYPYPPGLDSDGVDASNRLYSLGWRFYHPQ